MQYVSYLFENVERMLTFFFFCFSFCSAGACQVATGMSIAKQTGGKVFITSMCIGSGMGMAAVFVSEQ